MPDQVLLDGRDLRTLSLPYYRSKIGLVSQEPTLFATTIARNIAALTDASMASIEAAARAANAHDFIMQLPHKCGQRPQLLQSPAHQTGVHHAHHAVLSQQQVGIKAQHR